MTLSISVIDNTKFNFRKEPPSLHPLVAYRSDRSVLGFDELDLLTEGKISALRAFDISL